MFAALSLADRSLAERLITQTFHYVAPPPNNSGVDTPISSGTEGAIPLPKKLPLRSNPAEDKSQIIGSHLRDRVLGAIEACRDMLARELPERRDHWTNVRIPSPPPPPSFTSFSPYGFVVPKAATDRIPPANRKRSSKRKSTPSARSSSSAATRSGGTWSSCSARGASRRRARLTRRTASRTTGRATGTATRWRATRPCLGRRCRPRGGRWWRGRRGWMIRLGGHCDTPWLGKRLTGETAGWLWDWGGAFWLTGLVWHLGA